MTILQVHGTEYIEQPIAAELAVGDLVEVTDWPGIHEVVAVTNHWFFFISVPHTVIKFNKPHTERSKTYQLRSQLVRVYRRIPE